MNSFASWMKRYMTVVCFLVCWEISSRLGWVNPQFIPSFSSVVRNIAASLAAGTMLEHLTISLGRALGGLTLAFLIAVPLGVFLSGCSEKLRLALEPVSDLLSHVNPFVMFHIIIVFMGAGEMTKVTIIAWACLWPIVFSTLSGIVHADADQVKAARSFGLSRWQLTVKVLLPSAFPSVLTGTRLAAGYSLLFLIAAEMMGSSSGLGFLIYRAQSNYQIVDMFSGVVVIAVLAILLDGLMVAAGRRLSYKI